MTITEAAVRALAPGGRLEGDREGDARTVVERSADGTTRQWVRETLGADGRVTSRQVLKTEREERPPVPVAETVRRPRGRPRQPREPVPEAAVAFGHRLKVRRMTAGLTQAQLAGKVGAATAAIGYIESGRREPVWSLVLKLADVLGVSTEDFRETPVAAGTPAERVPTTFAEILTAKRVAAGLSQAELARRAGVTSAALSRYEHGQRRPAPAVVRRLATALGCSADDLRGTAERPPKMKGKS